MRRVPPARAVAAAVLGHLTQALPAALCPHRRWDGGEPWTIVVEQFVPRLVQLWLGIAVLPTRVHGETELGCGAAPETSWPTLGGGAGWSGRLEQHPPGILDMLGCSYVGGIRLGGPQQGPWASSPLYPWPHIEDRAPRVVGGCGS